MTTKTFITIGFKWIFLAVLWVICLMVASAVTGLTSSARNTNPAEALLALLVIGLLFSAVWSYVILRSRWHGWRLVIRDASR